MSNNKLVDITIHIDEDLSVERRETINAALRATGSVTDVYTDHKTPHLFVVKYDPQQGNSGQLLNVVAKHDVHAELIGL